MSKSDVPSVSSVEPLFTMIDGRPVCTRTWECAGDPKLSEGQTVKVGSADCRVVGKISSARVVTYQFSPTDAFELWQEGTKESGFE